MLSNSKAWIAQKGKLWVNFGRRRRGRTVSYKIIAYTSRLSVVWKLAFKDFVIWRIHRRTFYVDKNLSAILMKFKIWNPNGHYWNTVYLIKYLCKCKCFQFSDDLFHIWLECRQSTGRLPPSQSAQPMQAALSTVRARCYTESLPQRASRLSST